MDDPRTLGFEIPTTDSNAYSAAVNFNYLTPGAFEVPTLETGTTKIVFEHSATEDGTFVPLHFDGSRLEIAVSDVDVAFREQVDPGKYTCLEWVRIQAVDDDYAAVQQSTAAREFGIACREYK